MMVETFSMCLTKNQIADLDEFLSSRYYSPELLQVIKTNSEPIGTTYRGIMYRKDNVKIGHVYEHGYELSSWSKDKQVGVKFACNDYLPEGAVEDLYEEKFGEYKSYIQIEDTIYSQLEEEFCRILLVDKAGRGFDVLKHHTGHRFEHEKEIIVHMGKWVFTHIEECLFESTKKYYKITVERIKE